MKRLAVILAAVLLITASAAACGGGSTPATTPATGSAPAEIEATEFQGRALTPIREQRNNALKGTQQIDRAAYVLTVDGLVDKPLSLSYADLEAFEQVSWLMEMDCVEGWSFVAKWTGPRLMAIFDRAGIKPEALIAIFHTADVPAGYSSLDLQYIREKDIIAAMKLNDITLPSDRGFPMQIAAQSKYGYKWAKWVTRIELSSDHAFRGYWESVGYSNDAAVGGPAFDR